MSKDQATTKSNGEAPKKATKGRNPSSEEGALQRVLTFLKPSTVEELKKQDKPMSTIIRELVEAHLVK